MGSIESQTDLPLASGQGVGPDLIHLECSMALYRSIFWYCPCPRPHRIDTIYVNGVIRGPRHFVPDPPAIHAPVGDPPT